jgi:hypothetical protein
MSHSRPVRLVGLLRAKAAALEAVSAVALLLPFVLASASLMGYRAAVAPLAAATALGTTGAACTTIPPTCERGVLLPSRFRWTLVLTSASVWLCHRDNLLNLVRAEPTVASISRGLQGLAQLTMLSALSLALWLPAPVRPWLAIRLLLVGCGLAFVLCSLAIRAFGEPDDSYPPSSTTFPVSLAVASVMIALGAVTTEGVRRWQLIARDTLSLGQLALGEVEELFAPAMPPRECRRGPGLAGMDLPDALDLTATMSDMSTSTCSSSMTVASRPPRVQYVVAAGACQDETRTAEATRAQSLLNNALSLLVFSQFGYMLYLGW